MLYHRPRFECLPEPSGTWMVWDNDTHAAATLAGYQMRGQEDLRAQAACAVLISIYRNRLDAPSAREKRSRLPMRKPCFGQKQRS